MQVNKINSNTSFKRAIIIDNGKKDFQSNDIPNDIINLCKVINGKKSDCHSQEKSEEIKNFFRNVLGDYDPMNPVRAERGLYGDIVLLSGKEAKKVKEVKENVFQGIPGKKRMNKSRRNYLINKASKSVKSCVEHLIENGNKGRPESLIKIEPLPDNKDGKKITYTSYATSYLAEKDWAVDPNSQERQFPYPGFNFRNVYYESFEIIV